MDYQLLVVAHLLVAGYWLGTDLAVYYIAGTIANARHAAAVRSHAAHLMLVLDMVPRLALILTLALGLTLAIKLGLLPGGHVFLPWIWLACGVWLTLTIAVFRLERRPLGASLARVDGVIRAVMILLLTVLAIDAASPDGLVLEGRWLAAKLAILAAIIALGLLIRWQLRPFGALLGRALATDATPADHEAVSRLIAQVKIPVWFIWIGVIAAVVLGRLKPV